MVFGTNNNIRHGIQNCGAGLKYNQKVVGYSYDFHATIVPGNMFSQAGCYCSFINE